MIEKMPDDAEKYFNEKADGFLYELKPASQKKQNAPKRESSESHLFVAKNITREEAEINKIIEIDGFGTKVSRFFMVNNVSVGLDDDSYFQFETFIQALYKRREINRKLSFEFITNCGFEWFENQYKGIISRDVRFMNYLSEKATASIRRYKISIPISFMSIEISFKIGNCDFEYFKKEFFDEYFTKYREIARNSPKFKENEFDNFEKRRRKRYQGCVFASLILEAEKDKCIEIAKKEVNKSINVLRFFSPSTFLPEIPSYFGMMGKTDIPKEYIFIFEGQDHIPEIQEGIDENRSYRWKILKEELSKFEEMGVNVASELIVKENPNQLEDLVLNSMFLFGRSLYSNNYQDKIVNVLVSAEILFLQNQSEPIQFSLGLRLAFLTESNPDRRKYVKDLINKAYKIRSSYIHHGQIHQDWELLKNLQLTIWTAIRNTLMATKQIVKQKDLLDYIEKMILA